MPSQFLLRDIWQPHRIEDYKVHFARWNGDQHPLNVMARSMDEWRGWQEHHPSKNDFNRQFIFSLAQVYDEHDQWMFGGIWKINGIDKRTNGEKFYSVSLAEELSCLVGRLKLRHVHRQRGTRLNFENHYSAIIVSEILPEAYSGRKFSGFHKVHLNFQELEGLIAHDRVDWTTALGHVKGVYMITDTNTQKRYVGSAYGTEGVWARWKQYAKLGHGGNVGMKALLQDHDLDYCRKYFKFALLEHMDARTDDRFVTDREAFWKLLIDSRHIDTGLNFN